MSEQDHRTAIFDKWADEGFMSIDFFQFMYNDKIMEILRKKSNRNHKNGKEFLVTVSKKYQVLGIPLSGYYKVPNRQMFWSRQTNSRNVAVA